MQVVEGRPGSQLIAGKMHVADLRDAHAIQGIWEIANPEIVAGNHDVSGFKSESVCSQRCARGAKPGEEAPAIDFHDGSVVGPD